MQAYPATYFFLLRKKNNNLFTKCSLVSNGYAKHLFKTRMLGVRYITGTLRVNSSVYVMDLTVLFFLFFVMMSMVL